jgi:uncharacterized protein YbaP (TraB family)
LNFLIRTIAPAAVLLYGLLPITGLTATSACPAQLAFEKRPLEVLPGPYTKGLLWKIKPSGAPASYLFGTMHVAITRLPPAVALAVVKADSFITETMLDQSATGYYQAQMYSANAPNVGSLFKFAFRERLLDLLVAYGFDRKTALRLKPWAAFTALSRPKPTGVATLDQMLEAMARQRGTPVHGLETVEDLVATLDGIPLNQQRMIVRDTVCNRSQIEHQAQELATRYLDQDLAGMVAVSNRYEPHNPAVARTFKKRLLVERSRRMLKRLHSYLKQGNAFIAVGALHLPGKQGLLRGLASQGYRVTAIH